MGETAVASANGRHQKIQYKKTIFGYTPRWTVFSHLHPLARFSLILIFNAPFFIVNPFINLVFFVSVFCLYRVAHIPFKFIRTFLPFGLTLSFFLIITYTFFSSIFIQKPYQYVLFQIGTFKYCYENLLVTLMMWLRWMSAIFGTLFIFSITDERDMNMALKAVGTPFFLRLAIATGLRSFFSFYYDAMQIIEAQKARGLDLENMSVWKRLKYYIAVAVPLIMIELKRADEMSDAADARGYVAFGGAEVKAAPRTEYIGRDVVIQGKDRALITFSIVLLASAIILGLIPGAKEILGYFPASPAELAHIFGL
jgi:energy-coupling factor transport system permease protein